MAGLLLMATVFASGQAPSDRAEAIRQNIAASGAEVSVAFRTIDGTDELLIDVDKPVHAASTMKVPVMIELFRQAGEGLLSLERQTFRDAIPAGLPSGVTVAHKTGSSTRIHHDAGIVFARRPYVLVVLVRGIEDNKQSAALIAQISKIVYSDQNK